MLHLAGCIILENKSILLLHRISKDWYELPGGKIEQNETSDAAAIRELKEELNCTVQIQKKIGEMNFSENNNSMKYTWFLAKLAVNQTLKVGEKAHDHFKYIPLTELHKYKLSPNMMNLKNEIEKGNVKLKIIK